MKLCLFALAVATPLLGQCTYTVSPVAINVTANGGVNSVSVSTNSGTCTWSFSTDSPTWINLSVSGATLGDVPAQLRRLGHHPGARFDLVLLHVGGNDILRSPNLAVMQQATEALLPRLTAM